MVLDEPNQTSTPKRQTNKDLKVICPFLNHIIHSMYLITSSNLLCLDLHADTPSHVSKNHTFLFYKLPSVPVFFHAIVPREYVTRWLNCLTINGP